MFDVLEQIAFIPQEKPPPGEWIALRFRAVLVSFLVRSSATVPEHANMRIQLVGPNGEPHVERLEIDVDLESHSRARAYIELPAMPFAGNGIHTFMIYLEQDGTWSTVAEIPVDLQITERPAEQISDQLVEDTRELTPETRPKRRTAKRRPSKA